MSDFVQTTLDGLSFGASYSLIALSFTLIFGIMRRINLAFGSCLLFGAAAAVTLDGQFDVGIVGVLIATVLFSILASVYVERLCFAPHAGRFAASASMISSFAIWMQLDEVSSHLLPRRTHAYPSLDLPDFVYGDIFLRGDHLAQMALSLVLLAAVMIIARRSRFGLLLRAASENPRLAEQTGANLTRLGAKAFALAGFIGGMAAFFILSTDGHVTPLFGLWITMKGLVAMTLGGVGSLAGAIIGGLVLGLAEAHAAYFLGAEFRDITTFAILFLVLVVRPGGIMGVSIYRTDRLAGERI